MGLPQRRKRPPMMQPKPGSPIRCPGHLKWVRGHECSIAGKQHDWVELDSRTVYSVLHVCEGKIEAHHVREGNGGGMGLKPDDSSAVPLCSAAHKRGHETGWQTFEKEWSVDLSAIAAELWKRSAAAKKYEIRQGQKES